MTIFTSRRRTASRRNRKGERGRRRAQPYLLAGLFGVVLTVGGPLPPEGALLRASAQNPAPPQAPQYTPRPGQLAAPAAQSPLDEPLRLVAEARQTYQQVEDYSCTLISQERVRGRLGPENVIALKFRTRPFSVNMKWLAPREFVGQEVCYVHGRNNNKMRVQSKGIAGAFGFVSIDPNDRRVMEHSRHTIVEAGIGNLIERFANSWEAERRLGKTQARMAEYDYDGKRCIRIETFQTERAPQAYCYRTVAYFDKQTRLPIRVECYDWPRPGGPPQGELLESFSYTGIQFNRKLDDSVFNR